jgi:hypothetical protein
MSFNLLPDKRALASVVEDIEIYPEKGIAPKTIRYLNLAYEL